MYDGVNLHKGENAQQNIVKFIGCVTTQGG